MLEKILTYWIPAIFAILMLTASSYLPNPLRTPGETNPDVTQDNMTDTICAPHSQPCDEESERWTTKCIRPPASFTNKLKKKQLDSYYQGQGAPQEVEEDHLIPLTVGGCPTCETNLWPQPRAGKHPASEKDRCEVLTNKLVCEGKLTLKQGQDGLRNDWVTFCESLK